MAVGLARYIFPATLTLAAVALAGCGVVGEERGYYMKREWEQFKGPFWRDSAQYIDVPTARRQEQKNEYDICMHPNGSERVTTQNGVNDAVAYRRCVLSPYSTDAGSRMGIRPDGVGSVVKN